MEPTGTDTTRTPGIVIFVAILNFISASFAILAAVMSVVALVFGNTIGIYEIATREITRLYPNMNLTLGLNLVFGLLLFFSASFAAFFLAIGIGLLKGRRFAWYSQVAMSVLGLFGFPVGTILNALILTFFFQDTARRFFKV